MYNYTLASLSVSFWKLVSYLTYSKLSIQQEFERIKERNSPVGLTLAVTLVTMFDAVGSAHLFSSLLSPQLLYPSQT
jgi:hypothetical protein